MAGKDFPPKTSKPFSISETNNEFRADYLYGLEDNKDWKDHEYILRRIQLGRDTLRFLCDDLRVRDLQTVEEVGFLCGVGAARLMVSCR